MIRVVKERRHWCCSLHEIICKYSDVTWTPADLLRFDRLAMTTPLGSRKHGSVRGSSGDHWPLGGIEETGRGDGHHSSGEIVLNGWWAGSRENRGDLSWPPSSKIPSAPFVPPPGKIPNSWVKIPI